MDLNQLWQQYLGGLAKTATGQGGSSDVFTPALDKVLAQGYLTDTAEPGVVIPADQIGSDQPDPASPDD